MTTSRLHLFGLPHTITCDRFSHCAFTGKVQRFSPMMRSVGYHVTHYGVEGAESGADEQVNVLSHDEWQSLCAQSRKDKGLPVPTKHSFVGDLADTGCVLYRTFNERLAKILRERVTDKRDIFCYPLGHAHNVGKDMPNSKIETGIGYPTTFATNKVYESYAWQSYHMGKHGEKHQDYSWVIPNYYNLDEWPQGDGDGGYALFLGRICDIKGLRVIRELAKRRPGMQFVICGQGDPKPYLGSPNIKAIPPVHGIVRAELVGKATVMLAPSHYVEPFCGSVVEAALTGTPAITSDHGAFGETVEDGVTGYRCKTLGDFLAALDRVGEIDRDYVANRARRKYDMYRLAVKYDRVFRQVDDLWEEGWNTPESPISHEDYFRWDRPR